ncbi:MAG: CehA/McbA family metallohydrolase [Clostridia bacterium]|nr:CehA/McbA family metallohydrolase [Clostridia bacterium]
MDKRKLLLAAERVITQEDDSTTHSFSFSVPRDTEAVSLKLTYDPGAESDPERAKKIIGDILEAQTPWLEPDREWKKYFPISNLLTLSLDGPHGHRGNAHRKASGEVMYVSEKYASPGFYRGRPESGEWKVSVHIHCAVTAECSYSLEVEALSEADVPGPRKDLPAKLESKPAVGKLKWVPAELHCHTLNSDGVMSLAELTSYAKERGLGIIALTDHNTDSAAVYADPSGTVIRGCELTTYHGHILSLGCCRIPEWRDLVVGDPDTAFRRIREAGGLSGIAHPFRPGGPVGTGCHFDYKVSDPGLIDYCEILYAGDPSENRANVKAFEEWTAMLDRGFRITPVNGLDWHKKDHVPDLVGKRGYVGVTWLGLEPGEPVCAASALRALRSGRASACVGNPIEFSLSRQDATWLPGDTASPGKASVRVDVLPSSVLCRSDVRISSAVLIGEKGKREPLTRTGETRFEGETVLENGWNSAELWGTVDGRECMLGISAPIYVRHSAMITAHSGCEGTPPNSPEHIRAAVASGADALEVDVRKASDGRLYLSHNLPEDGEDCIGLERCFRMVHPCGNMKVNCDVKEPGIACDVLALARTCGMGSRVIFTGELELEEGIVAAGSEAEWWVNLAYAESGEAELRRALHKMEVSGSQVLNMNFKNVFAAPDLYADCLPVISAWTPSNEQAIRRLLEAGVMNITTRTPVDAVRLRAEYESVNF